MLAASRIKTVRKEKGFTQKQLAEILGVATGTLQQYELGKREPSFETLVILAKKFRVSADYLLGISDNPSPSIEKQAICDYTGLSLSAVENLHEEACKEYGNHSISEIIGRSLKDYRILNRSLYGALSSSVVNYKGKVINLRENSTNDAVYTLRRILDDIYKANGGPEKEEFLLKQMGDQNGHDQAD